MALAFGWSLEILRIILLWVFVVGQWNCSKFPLTSSGDGIAAIHGVGTILGGDTQGFAFFGFNILLSLVLGSAVNALIGGIGEEIGWRGVLQPEMERRFGPLAGTLVVGVIWAAWHLPANLVGYNDPVHPILGALVVFPVVIVCISYGYAWLFGRHGSVWGVALAHGAYNNIRSGDFLMVASSWLADTLTTVGAALILLAVFALRLQLRSSPKPAVVTSSPQRFDM